MKKLTNDLIRSVRNLLLEYSGTVLTDEVLLDRMTHFDNYAYQYLSVNGDLTEFWMDVTLEPRVHCLQFPRVVHNLRIDKVYYDLNGVWVPLKKETQSRVFEKLYLKAPTGYPYIWAQVGRGDLLVSPTSRTVKLRVFFVPEALPLAKADGVVIDIDANELHLELMGDTLTEKSLGNFPLCSIWTDTGDLCGHWYYKLNGNRLELMASSEAKVLDRISYAPRKAYVETATKAPTGYVLTLSDTSHLKIGDYLETKRVNSGVYVSTYQYEHKTQDLIDTLNGSTKDFPDVELPFVGNLVFKVMAINGNQVTVAGIDGAEFPQYFFDGYYGSKPTDVSAKHIRFKGETTVNIAGTELLSGTYVLAFLDDVSGLSDYRVRATKATTGSTEWTVPYVLPVIYSDPAVIPSNFGIFFNRVDVYELSDLETPVISYQNCTYTSKGYGNKIVAVDPVTAEEKPHGVTDGLQYPQVCRLSFKGALDLLSDVNYIKAQANSESEVVLTRNISVLYSMAEPTNTSQSGLPRLKKFEPGFEEFVGYEVWTYTPACIECMYLEDAQKTGGLSRLYRSVQVGSVVTYGVTSPFLSSYGYEPAIVTATASSVQGSLHEATEQLANELGEHIKLLKSDRAGRDSPSHVIRTSTVSRGTLRDYR